MPQRRAFTQNIIYDVFALVNTEFDFLARLLSLIRKIERDFGVFRAFKQSANGLRLNFESRTCPNAAKIVVTRGKYYFATRGIQYTEAARRAFFSRISAKQGFGAAERIE